jgi:hypothetical protein
VTIRDDRQLVAALLDVDGVASASIEATRVGPGTLRLQLAAGSDQVVVAAAVNSVLRTRFGLAVDPDRVRVVDEAATPLRLPTPPVPTPSNPTLLNPTLLNPGGQDTGAGKHAVADGSASGADVGVEGGLPSGPVTPAIGAYARDAGGAPRIITSDLRTANGVEHPPVPEVTLTRPSRLTIERVQLVSAGLGATVTVTLGLDGRTLEGAAEGAATQTALLRSVATATLRAIEGITGATARFEVEHVEVARTGTDQTALVVITMLTGRSTQRLSGASVVREDTRQAVIRAVLAALNRRVEPLLGEH